MGQVLVSTSFDDMRSRHMRFLQAAKNVGDVHVLLWRDASIRAMNGRDPKFPQEERQYFVSAIRYVDRLSLVDANTPDTVPEDHIERGAIWAVEESDVNHAKESFCRGNKLEIRPISEQQLRSFPEPEESPNGTALSGQKRVLVTGCYDWFHSGHVRFFEEVSEIGDLYVVVGHDANIRLLKGDGHPMYSEDERRYMAGSIRFVKRAYVSSGNGWLDAEPEIERIKPDIYAVNKDGDRPEKREYCLAHGIEYHVLTRLPKGGLPKRQSTDLRGF